MGRRASLLAALALTATVALAFGGPAAAGGWAVTTFDQLPPEFVAGQTYHLGYTIRQHGVTPIRVDRTEVIATPVTGGAPLSFVGAPQGELGHYATAVAFPAGSYTWRVTQQPFQAQELGRLAVGGAAVVPAAPASGPTAPETPLPSPRPLSVALAVATLASALLFAAQLVRHAGRRGVSGAS